MSRNNFFGKGSVVVPSDGEGAVRRLAITADRLVTRPFAGIDVIPDVISYAARTHGPREAVGWRNVVRIHEEEKETKKVVAGKEVVERKIWKYFELSDFEYISFLDVRGRILELARGLMNRGIEKEDVFNIYAQTSVNWQLMSHACATISTTVAAAYDTLGEADLAHSLSEPDCVGIFTNAELLPTLARVIRQTPSVRLVVYDGEPKWVLLDQIRGVREGIEVVSLDQLCGTGRAEPLEILESRKPTPEDVALIMYTSGSTGAPKGVMLTHGNVIASIGGIYNLLGHHLRTDDAFLAFLPLAHIFEYVVEMTLFMVGMKTGYGRYARVDTLTDTLVRNCKGDLVTFRPTILVGVPQVWETICKEILAKVNTSGTLRKSIFNGAMAVMKANVPVLADIADAAVLSGAKAVTGGRLRLALNGGAPLSKKTQEFLSVALVTMLQGYGMTESCAMCTALPPELMQYGCVGLPMPCIEIQLIDVPEFGYKALGNPPQGEVCIRGPSVTKGYYKRPDLNSDETIFTKDGWLRTRDVGQWNPDGTLSLIDRLGSLVKLQSDEVPQLEKTVQLCHDQLPDAQAAANQKEDSSYKIASSLRAQEQNSSVQIAHLDTTIQQLSSQLSDSQHVFERKENNLNETIKSLRAQHKNSDTKIAGLEKAVQQLRNQLSDSQRAFHQKEQNLNETIKSSDAKIVRLEETTQQLRTQLSDSQRAFNQKENSLNETIISSKTKITHLEETTQQLRNQLSDSQRALDQKENNLNETIQLSNRKIVRLEETAQHLRVELADFQRNADSLIRAHEQIHECETLYTEGRIIDAANSLLEITNTVTEEVKANDIVADWSARFTNRCISTLEIIGDRKLTAEKHDEALSSYFTALLLSPSAPSTLLTKWANVVLMRGSVNDVLVATAKFKLSRFSMYRVTCDTLQEDGHITKAIECFRQMQSELEDDASIHDERVKWELDFRQRCVDKLEMLGDAAMETKDFNAANRHYSIALTFSLTMQCDILLKRSKARTHMCSWEEALLDANKAIELDPSSPWGYEMRRAALLGARRYDDAIDAYNEMLSKLEQSPDPVTRKSRDHYVSPSETKEAIRSSMKTQQRDAPLAIINTETGRLCDANERMAEFVADPSYKKLVASMTQLDHGRISQTVQEYFRYATFSHTWEGAEPLYEDVRPESLHKLPLPLSPIFSKILMFCRIAREAGLRWAWSDTCCINKMDGSVLQESLISMFKWYQGSSLTVIHLKGVVSDSDRLAIIECLWNTRAWTLQEFFASRVVRFYTEDWKPYLPHEIVYNHKESHVIMEQMAAATGVVASVLLSLRPGPENVRQKLCLAATRVATKQEDIAYSLFGIFEVSLHATYGEGQERALGRLLQEVLTRSGDVTILAWTGKVSEYNSCLPAEITVYREPVSPHIPSPMEESQLDTLVTQLQMSLSETLDSALMLYDQIKHLPSPRLASQRLTLSCIMFPLRNQLISAGGSRQRVYRTRTPLLRAIEIKTTEDLSSMENLVLVHPWPKCLVDPAHPFEDLDEDDDAELLSPVDGVDGDDDTDTPFTDALSPSPSHVVSPLSHSSQSQLDKPTRALRLFARLRQPFGALLLVPLTNTEYKRIASDNPIIVQLSKNVTPAHLVPKIRLLDIL